MATARKWVYVHGSGKVGNYAYSVSTYYHPDYVASKHTLCWNTGSGYSTCNCLSHNNEAFYHLPSYYPNSSSIATSLISKIDIYIGAGSPQGASSVSTVASAWIGLPCGIVYGANAANETNVSAISITQGASFYEYNCTARSNNVSFGTVDGGASTSYKYVSNSMGKLPDGIRISAKRMPTIGKKNGCSFLGYYYNGALKKAADMPVEFSNAVAVFASPFTVVFNNNGGSGLMGSATYNGGVEDYVPQGNIATNTFTKSGYVFTGWGVSLSGGTTFLDGASVSSIFETLSPAAGSTVTLYAQWRRPTVYITNPGTSYGSLTLYRNSVATANKVATESGGVLAADVSNGTYIVVCDISNSLYEGGGVSDGTSNISATIDSSGRNITIFSLSSTYEGTFYYNKRETYEITFSLSPLNAGSVEMTKTDGSTTPDDNGKWLPQVFLIYVTPATGYDFASLHVVDVVDSSGSQAAVSNPPISPSYYQCDLSGMNDKTRIDLVFVKQKFDVEVCVDDASASVGVATVNDSDAGVSDVEYGTSVTYKAFLQDGVSVDDYKFEGWYLNGLKISEAAEFAYEITKAVRIVAKFAAKFAIGVAFTDNRADTSTAIAQVATLVLNGTTYEISAPVTNATFVVLGASASWAVTPSADWYFNAFYAPSDTAYANALDYERIGSVAVVSEATHIVARLTTVKIQSSAVVKVHVNDPATDVSPDTSDPVITASGYETAIADNGYSFTLDGTGSIMFTAKAMVEVGGVTYAFNCFATDVPASVNCKVLSRELTYQRALNSPKVVIYALYGAFAKVGVSVAYGSGSNRTMGTLFIGDETNEESGVAKVTKNVEQGTTVTISATAKNGYRFCGWYFGGNISGEPDEASATLEVFVTSERTILAAFEKARDSIYEWEGASENKMMEWKSKVYVAARPFNPSAIRVDTNGYPVGEMCVGMFSAPDAEETAVSILKNVASQDSRRLPKRRPERYIQVTVKNDQEVDRILVGTSMEGVSI